MEEAGVSTVMGRRRTLDWGPQGRHAWEGCGGRREERPRSGERHFRERSSLWRLSSVSSSSHFCFPTAGCSVRLPSALALTWRRLSRWSVSEKGPQMLPHHLAVASAKEELTPSPHGRIPLAPKTALREGCCRGSSNVGMRGFRRLPCLGAHSHRKSHLTLNYI